MRGPTMQVGTIRYRRPHLVLCEVSRERASGHSGQMSSPGGQVNRGGKIGGAPSKNLYITAREKSQLRSARQSQRSAQDRVKSKIKFEICRVRANKTRLGTERDWRQGKICLLRSTRATVRRYRHTTLVK